MRPYSQYLNTYARSFPDTMGQLSSSLAVNGASAEEIQNILSSSELVKEVESGNNIALADSGVLVLYAWLKRDRNREISNTVCQILPTPAYLDNGEDWLVWWAVSAVLYISQYENKTMSEVFEVMNLEEIIQKGVRYHTSPYFDCFYQECYLPKEQARNEKHDAE